MGEGSLRMVVFVFSMKIGVAIWGSISTAVAPGPFGPLTPLTLNLKTD